MTHLAGLNNIMLTGKLLDDICKECCIETHAGKIALEQALKNIQLLDKKQQDYGPRNISSFGLLGVLVRMNDKFERLKNNISFESVDGEVRVFLKVPANETMEDTFRDVSNYAIISLMLKNNTWPKE